MNAAARAKKGGPCEIRDGDTSVSVDAQAQAGYILNDIGGLL